MAHIAFIRLPLLSKNQKTVLFRGVVTKVEPIPGKDRFKVSIIQTFGKSERVHCPSKRVAYLFEDIRVMTDVRVAIIFDQGKHNGYLPREGSGVVAHCSMYICPLSCLRRVPFAYLWDTFESESTGSRITSNRT